jgi:hypothetical protein
VNEPCDVTAVDVVADLLSLISVNPVFPPLEVAAHEITQEAMQLHAAMVGTRQAAAAQAAGWHTEVTAVFLHHHISGNLACAEEAVQTVIDGERLRNTRNVLRIGVVPSCFLLGESDPVRSVPVDLIRAQVDERTFGAAAARRFEQV